MGVSLSVTHFITRMLLISPTRSFTGLIHVFMIPAGDTTAFLSYISMGLVTGMPFFPLRARGNSGGMISQMQIPSGNIGVNKADHDSALSLPVTMLITIIVLYCIKKTFKLGTRPLHSLCGSHKNSPLATLTCLWMSGRSKKREWDIKFAVWFPQRIVRIPRQSVGFRFTPWRKSQPHRLWVYGCLILTLPLGKQAVFSFNFLGITALKDPS